MIDQNENERERTLEAVCTRVLASVTLPELSDEEGTLLIEKALQIAHKRILKKESENQVDE